MIIVLSRKQILNKLRDELPNLKNKFSIKRIGVFGSYAEENQVLESDIDIIVEFEKPIGLSFMDLIEYLENFFRKKVDILTSAGLKSIRIKKVAEDIERSIVYA